MKRGSREFEPVRRWLLVGEVLLDKGVVDLELLFESRGDVLRKAASYTSPAVGRLSVPLAQSRALMLLNDAAVLREASDRGTKKCSPSIVKVVDVRLHLILA